MQRVLNTRAGIWSTALLLAAFLTIVLLTILATGWAEIGAAFARIKLWHLAVLIGLSIINYGSRALRWRLMTQAVGLPTAFLQDMRHYTAGLALMATPGRLGEFVRLRWLSKETGEPFERTAPVAYADRALDLATVPILIALAAALSALGTNLVWVLVAVSLALAWIATNARLLRWIITWAWRTIGRWPRMFVRLRRLAASIGIFTRPSIALPALLLGAFGWFCEGLSFGLLLGWLGAPVPIWTAVAIFLAAMTSGALAGMPGGLGGAEAAMVALLLLVDVPIDIAIAATAVIRVTTMWFAILVGALVFPFAEGISVRAHARDMETDK